MTLHHPQITRCRPQVVGSKCQNCRRWADHPEQVIYQVTRVINTTGPKDAACVYVPVSLQEPA